MYEISLNVLSIFILSLQICEKKYLVFVCRIQFQINQNKKENSQKKTVLCYLRRNVYEKSCVFEIFYSGAILMKGALL